MSSFGLVALPPIARLSPRVWNILGLNPGPYTLQGSNTYLVGTGKSRILVDSGAGVSGYLPSLLSCMKQAGCDSLSCVLVTHWHHDHTGGLHDITQHFSPALPVYKHQIHLRGAAPPSVLYRPLSPSSSFTVDGATLTCVSTPGHTADHVSFLLHEEHALFIGDAVLGQGTTVFRHLSDYSRTLQTVQQLAPLRLYCGHGPVVDDVQVKLTEYLQHRRQREEQLYAVMVNEGDKGSTALQLVEKVYPPLSPAVLPAAVQNVVLHLEKLRLEGKIERVDAAVEDEEEIRKEKQMAGSGGGESTAEWSDKDYGELRESTAAMVQRKAEWLWKAVVGS
jgi:endoribonuclease LACTB2